MQAFNGISSESTVHLSESALARVQIIVRTKPGSVPEFDVREIEKQIVKAARRWQDDLHDALIAHFGEERGNQLYHRFGNAFPAGYREDRSRHRSSSPTPRSWIPSGRKENSRWIFTPATN